MSDFTVHHLTCNYQTNPIGLDDMPRFSWQMSSAIQNDAQTAYRILVADTQQALAKGPYVWDSGVVRSNQNLYHALPESAALQPRTRYWWSVEVQNTAGEKAASEAAFFETGKRDEEWSARWIGAGYVKKEADTHGAPMLRRVIKPGKKVQEARLYICGLGYYEAFIEGEKVSENILTPDPTKYDTRVDYRAYDVTSYIRQKPFALGILLGNSWYNYFEQDEWNTKGAPWHAYPKCIAELWLQYEDGSEEVIETDSSWTSNPSPITYNCIRNGEHYDARLEQQGWDTAAFDDGGWTPVAIVRGAGGVMTGCVSQAVRVMELMKPVDFWQNKEGGWIFDFGQNMSGNALLVAEGEWGNKITLRYSEEITTDRQHIDASHIDGFVKSGDFQTERYIKGSDGREEWHSRFVYHGYRYIELTGMDKVDANTLTTRMMHTSFGGNGGFTCSEERINQIMSLCHWSTISNFVNRPTDCPHREKNSWTGDAAVASEQMLWMYDSAPALLKWLDDVCDAQRPDGQIPCVIPSTGWGYNALNGPDWSKALTEVPWNVYMLTGDKGILAKYYPYIKKHFTFVLSMQQDWLVDYGLGDWCAPFDGPALAVNMGSFKAPRILTDTICFYYAAQKLAAMEEILGLPETSKLYAEKIREAWRNRFINFDTMQIESDCQTVYGAALYHNMVEGGQQEKVLQHLVRTFAEKNYHPDYGLLGSRFVMQTLGEHRRTDVIAKSLLCDGYPSYGYWLELGRTTLGEIWSGIGSQNHYMFSDIVAVLMKYFAGIRPDETGEAGLRAITIQPDGLQHFSSLSGWHLSPHGKVAVEWSTQGEEISLKIEIPFGVTAKLALPSGFTSQVALPEQIGSGTYTFALQRSAQ